MIDVLFRAKCKQGNFQLQQQSSVDMHRKSISAAQRKNCEVHKIFDCSSVVRCMPMPFCISSFGFVCLYLRMRGVPLRIGTNLYLHLYFSIFFFFVIFSNIVYATVRAYVINLAVSQTISILKGLGAVPICVCKAM